MRDKSSRSSFRHSGRIVSAGRVEFRYLLILYLLTLPFQLLTTGSLLEQGSTALVALTAVHAGLVATLFWTLLFNGIVATQFVEDGTISSILVSAAMVCLGFLRLMLH